MKIGSVDIKTPHDDKTSFSPCWRYEVAKTLKTIQGTCVVPYLISKDDHIRQHTQYLRLVDGHPDIAARRFKDNHLATCWFAGSNNGKYPIKYYLEPLLLTELNYYSIADHLNANRSTVETYEKLFFNIRGDNGKICYSHYLRMNFATNGKLEIKEEDYNPQTLWKVAAANYGSKALMAIWGVIDGNEITSDDILSACRDSIKFERFIARRISNFDLISADNAATNRMKLKLEEKIAGKLTGGSKDDIVDKDVQELLLNRLLTKPKMISQASSEEEVQALQEALQKKLSVQHNIDGVKIEDKGKQISGNMFKEDIHKKAKNE